MAEPNLEESPSSKELIKKREALFSEKFRDYLKNKESSTNNAVNKSTTQPFFLTKNYSASSSETTASESSKKSGKKVKKKVKERQSHWDYRYAYRNRLIQCSLLKSEEEIVLPDELKPLLMNVTILLQDLKQFPSGFENLYTLISKVTTLVTEFIRRPLQKIYGDKKTEHSKNVDKTVEMIMTLLEEYKNSPNLNSDNSVREYKRIEKEIAKRNEQIAEAKKRLLNEAEEIDLKTKDLNLHVRNSILANENLKSEIKFNQNRVKKYKKVLIEKEWTKNKLETELTHLKKKIPKADLSDNETFDKQTEWLESSLKNENYPKGLLLKNRNKKARKVKGVLK